MESKLLSEYWDWDVITVLEFELSSVVSEPCDQESGIIHVSHKDCANVITDMMNIAHRFCNNKLIRDFLLGAYDNCIVTLDCN